MPIDAAPRTVPPRAEGPGRNRRRLWHASPPGEQRLVWGGGVVALVAIAGFFALAQAGGPDLWVPIVVLLVVTAISVPLCARSAGTPIDPRLRRLLLVAFALKMLCTLPRYAMNEVVYDGNADAGQYHQAGEVFASNVGEGRWSLEGSDLEGLPSQTQAVGFVVGSTYLVTGASQMAGYLVFTWICWLGLLAAFRGARRAYPDAPPRRTAALIFLVPSVLYWPSSIGKDALVIFGLGLVVCGAVRIVRAEGPWVGAATATVGAALVFQVRPHLVLIALVGLAATVVARPATVRGKRSVAGRVLLAVLVAAALPVGFAKLDDLYGNRPGEGSLVDRALEQTAAQTGVGGSTFEARPVASPADLPFAAVNVLYRPFLHEARSVPVLISAMEGTVLAVLTVAGIRVVRRAGLSALRDPVVAFALGYSLAFIYAFSAFGNAGLLARQRVQLLPILALLAIGLLEHRRRAGSRSNPLEVATGGAA